MIYEVAVTGSLSVGNSQTPVIQITGVETIVKVYAVVKTAPTGQSIILDVKKNGVSIWNANQANRLAISAGATTGNQTTFDVSPATLLGEGDLLTFDLDQVGSGTPGADLTMTVKTQ